MTLHRDLQWNNTRIHMGLNRLSKNLAKVVFSFLTATKLDLS